MKLVLALVSKKDRKDAMAELVRGGFHVTCVAATGGFMGHGTATLLIGTHAELVGQCVEILRETCKARKYDISKIPRANRQVLETGEPMPAEVTVGGARVFVLNIEENFKL